MASQKTEEELAKIANAITDGIMATLIFDLPGIRKAVDKLPRKEWLDELDGIKAEVREILVRFFM